MMVQRFEYTAQGIRVQTLEEIIEDSTQRYHSIFGNSLNTTSGAVSGQIIRIHGEQLAEAQAAVAALENSTDVDAATGASLLSWGSITGTDLRGASFSTVRGVLTFSAEGQPVPNNFQFRNEDQSTVWRVINGPYVSPPGGGSVSAQLQATTVGPLVANSSTTWSQIVGNPTLVGFTNPAEDATLGELQESEPAYRRRRSVEARSQGIGSRAAIGSVVSKVNTANGRVDTVAVSHNPSIDPVDGDGVPFKAFRVIVETTPSPPAPALVQDIVDAIGSTLGAGGQAYGTDHTGVYVDSEGNVENIGFDLVELVDAFVCVELTTTGDPDEPPIPSTPAVMATIVRDAIIDSQVFFRGRGRNARPDDYIGVVQELIRDEQISGIDLTEVGLSIASKDDAESNLGNNTPIPIGANQRVDIDSGEVRIIIDGLTVIS